MPETKQVKEKTPSVKAVGKDDGFTELADRVRGGAIDLGEWNTNDYDDLDAQADAVIGEQSAEKKAVEREQEPVAAPEPAEQEKAQAIELPPSEKAEGEEEPKQEPLPKWQDIVKEGGGKIAVQDPDTAEKEELSEGDEGVRDTINKAKAAQEGIQDMLDKKEDEEKPKKPKTIKGAKPSIRNLFKKKSYKKKEALLVIDESEGVSEKKPSIMLEDAYSRKIIPKSSYEKHSGEGVERYILNKDGTVEARDTENTLVFKLKWAGGENDSVKRVKAAPKQAEAETKEAETTKEEAKEDEKFPAPPVEEMQDAFEKVMKSGKRVENTVTALTCIASVAGAGAALTTGLTLVSAGLFVALPLAAGAAGLWIARNHYKRKMKSMLKDIKEGDTLSQIMDKYYVDETYGKLFVSSLDTTQAHNLFKKIKDDTAKSNWFKKMLSSRQMKELKPVFEQIVKSAEAQKAKASA